MAILSTGTSGIFRIFYRNLMKKETAVFLNRINQLPQNLARVDHLVESLTEVMKISNSSLLPIVSIVFYCLYIVCLLFQI